VGTMSQWEKALETGAIFGVLCLLWEIYKRKSFPQALELAGTVFLSLAFGMMMTFEWEVLHGKLAVIFAATILGLIVVGLLERRARTRA
jgi:O-antigen/teichoic acid export membrane protein